jgi:hypothetical protein
MPLSEERGKAFILIMSYWQKRDGAASYIVSDIFLDILTSNYKFFFLQMKNYPTEFDNWLLELGNLSFVWFKEPPSPLEKKKEELINFLMGISDLDENSDSLRMRLIKVLNKIEPRQVD